MLLCLEDLHWADADTRWLLRGVMEATAGRAVAVLATWRTAEPDDGFTDLPPRVRRIPVAPLVRTLTEDLARELAGGDLADDAVQQAARQSGGNPFFVGELVRMHLLGGVGGERVPRGVRDVLARRLARLRSATVDVLTAAAVLGTEADLAVLALAVGQPPPDVRVVLEEAVRAGLVEPPGDRGAVRFVHAVVREVLLEEAGPAVARPCTHWPPVPSRSTGPTPTRRWPCTGRRHRERTPSSGRHPRAGSPGRRAGRLRAGAGSRFGALVTDRVDDSDDLLALGDLRARAGDLAHAREDLLRAASRARHAGRVDVLARAALALSGGEGGFEVALNDDVQIQLLQEAVRSLPPGGLRARVLARQAVATSVTATQAERVAMARAGVREAEEAGDEAALLHALAAYADMIGGPRHVADRRAVADRMLVLAQGLGDANGELLARRFRLVALLEVGDFPAVDGEIAAFDALAHRTQEPGHLWYPPLWRGMRALLAGRAADAEAFADQVEAVGTRAQSLNARMLAATLRSAVHWGHPEAYVDLVAAVEVYARDVPPDIPQFLIAQASLYAGARDVQRTARCYRPVADAGFRTLPEDAEYLGGLMGAVDAATLLGDRAGAEVLVGLLEPFADVWIVDGIGRRAGG